jgi:hypothetical protein
MNLKKSNKPLIAAKQDTFYYTSPKKLMGKCNSIKKREQEGTETSYLWKTERNKTNED